MSRRKIDSFVFFFIHGSFVLEYVDLSNQRDFFCLGSLVLETCAIKSVENARRQKNLRNMR